jgi:hypothetical protein
MTTFQSSNQVVHLSREVAATLTSLKKKMERSKKLGYDDLVWSYGAEMLHIINRSTIHDLSTGNYTSDDLLMFCETAKSYEEVQEAPVKKGIHLNLALIEGSALANDILEVLKKHEGEITHG